VIAGRVDTAVVGECFEQFSQQLQKKAYVLLDNASIHKSQEFIRHILYRTLLLSHSEMDI